MILQPKSIIARLNRISVEYVLAKKKFERMKHVKNLEEECKSIWRKMRDLKREFIGLEKLVFEKEIDIEYFIEQKRNTLNGMKFALEHARKELTK